MLLCLANKWRDHSCFLFIFPSCFWGRFSNGAQRGPHGSGVAELALGNIGRRKCPGAVWWLTSGVALSLLARSQGSFKKFPQVLLYLPTVSLPRIGCRAGSAGCWEASWLQSSCDLPVRRKCRDISRAQLEAGMERGEIDCGPLPSILPVKKLL